MSQIKSTEAPRPLTLKEKRVLEFLEEYMKQRGIAPSFQEVCQHFGFASYNSVQRYFKQLETKGYIHVPGENQKRAVTLLQPSSAVQATIEEWHKESIPSPSSVTSMIPHPMAEVFALPMLGRVAAGKPIEAIEHDEFIDVPASLVRHADRTYALRVQGQSMIEDGIFDGDVILVQRQSHASNGEIVVAVVGEEATVKRFYLHRSDQSTKRRQLKAPRRGGGQIEQMVELRPANSDMSPMWYRPGEVQIRGIVVGLIRKF